MYACFSADPDGTFITNDIVVWGTESINDGGVITRVDANEHIQVSVAGTYRIDCVIACNCTATSAFEMTLQKDAGTGTWADVGPLFGAVGFAFFGNSSGSVSLIVDLLLNEKVRVLCKTRSGSGATVLNAASSLCLQQIN